MDRMKEAVKMILEKLHDNGECVFTKDGKKWVF